MKRLDFSSLETLLSPSHLIFHLHFSSLTQSHSPRLIFHLHDTSPLPPHPKAFTFPHPFPSSPFHSSPSLQIPSPPNSPSLLPDLHLAGEDEDTGAQVLTSSFWPFGLSSIWVLKILFSYLERKIIKGVSDVGMAEFSSFMAAQRSALGNSATRLPKSDYVRHFASNANHSTKDILQRNGIPAMYGGQPDRECLASLRSPFQILENHGGSKINICFARSFASKASKKETQKQSELEYGAKKGDGLRFFPPADRQTQEMHFQTMMQDIAASLLMEFEKYVFQAEYSGTISQDTFGFAS
ncbi:TRAPP II COMPLEX TRS120-RELATED [Salix koriyanagi]|uniref:TRAPP II COMPLEX TRS120-RELATED n=1 Tax=Salix koriyanagi TaxID=2511006 RepID=A0A9Q0UZL3_9ROSI|nr:TRAPP II COMPLEX TRS120-RELATED [Salix koriyanagi]